MELGVLGPLELVSEGAPIPLGGPKQRLVLGLLTARRGHIVGLDELIDGLWPDGPQARPRKTVQVYVTRLRRALGDRADAIRSEAGGYRLDPVLVPVDADAFEAEVRAATADPDVDRAAEVLRRALGRWQGDAYGDLRECLDLVPGAVQLDSRRLAAQHELFERVVRRRPRDVLAELEQAVEANPLHEGFAAQLMTAQYLVGRQADALHTYRTLRRRLGEELGLEPGPALRDLEGRILRHQVVAEASAEPVPERQRRRVSVVSVELSVAGSGDVDPEVEMAIATPARRAARSRLVERGGVILGADGDAISACFGYPSAERAAERAVLAAIAIRDLADERLSVRVGVDTGIVVIEGGGRELSGIAGEPLRAAARLRGAAAPGQIVLGTSTAVALDGVVATSRHDGDADRHLVGDVVETQHEPGGVDGLVARDAAFDELAELAGRAATQFVPVVVSGPAGIGKSAVVERFVTDGFPGAVWAYGDRRHSATGLHPLRPVLPELFEAGAEPSDRAILQALGERWAGRLPVLVVEDVDAADPSTLDLIDTLPEHLAHGLLVLTTRSPGPLEIAGDVVARIALGPLDRAASRTVAAEVAAGRRLRLDTLNEIADRAGGVPLHIQALTRAVLDGASGTSAVPTSLYDSLMAELDRLGPARSLAQRLAVLGPSFDAAEIGHVTAGMATAPADLEAMVAAGVLRGDGTRYRFASALVAETAYESLLRADRVALHEAIADAMSTHGAPPERLAFHLEAAGRPFDAAVAWRRASAEAVRRARHREAIHHARRALSVLDRHEPAPDGGETRRRALTTLAIGLQAISYGGAELLDVVAEARRAGVGDGDLRRRLVLDVIEISARHEGGDFAAAVKIAEQLVEEAVAAGDDHSLAHARRFLGASHMWRGDLARGTSELEQAVELAEALGATDPVNARSEGATWCLLGLAACFADRPGEAQRLLDRARAVVPAEDGYTRCLVAATAAMSDQLADRPGTVRAAVEPVWSLAMDLGSDFWFAWAQALLGWAVAADDADAGLAMLSETLDATTTRQTKPYFLGLLGARLCEHGRIDEGLGRLDEALALLDETDERLWEPMLRFTRARWLAVAGDRPGAVAEGAAAAALAASTGQQLVVRWHEAWRP